jgi:hypothetical protein
MVVASMRGQKYTLGDGPGGQDESGGDDESGDNGESR